MNQDQLKKLKIDIVYFAKHILNFIPFDYQEKLLNDPSKRLIAICGRQVGKSTCAGVKVTHFAVSNPNTTTIIVSATLRQSMETFDKVLAFVESSVLKRSVIRKTRTQIRFTNGSRILCLPSGRFGSTLRGLTVHFAVVDEAAFIYDEVITNVIFPMLLTTNGTVWMLSSPWDKNHITYKCFTHPDWSIYHLPSSVSPLVSKDFLDEQRALIGEERFQLEYLGNFVDDANSYFPMTLIRTCLQDYTPTLAIGKELYAGYDVGGKEDYAALIAIERTPESKLQVQHLKSELGKTYTQFTVEVADLHEQFNFKKVLIDQTGLGAPVVEHARELKLPCGGITLTSKRREELLANVKILLETKNLILPHDLNLLNALNCIEYTRTRTGGFQFTHREGTHDDLAYALALACECVREREEEGTLLRV